VAPAASADVPDQQAVRLVLLAPGVEHKAGAEASRAMEAAGDFLNNRGKAPRLHRNMVVFLAADVDYMTRLKQDMRSLMAWRVAKADAKQLHLDEAQKDEVDENIKKLAKTVGERVQEAYRHLLVPTQSGSAPVSWAQKTVSGLGIVAKAAKGLQEDALLTGALNAKVLLHEMDSHGLWRDRDDLAVGDLWDDFTRYLYMFRLESYDVLREGIKAGVLAGGYFAYADGKDEAGRYENLCLGSERGYLSVTKEGLLVRLDAAKGQIEREEAEKARQAAPQGPLPLRGGDGGDRLGQAGSVVGEGREGAGGARAGGGGLGGAAGGRGTAPRPEPQPPEKKNTHFYGSVRLEPSKIGAAAGDINANVLQYLGQLPGVSMEVTLDIKADIPEGAPADVARTVSENCKALKFTSAEFED
jgi:hypothetical protein